MTTAQRKTIQKMKENLLSADKQDGFNLVQLRFFREPNTNNVIAKVEVARTLVNVVDASTMFYRITPNGIKRTMTHIEGTLKQVTAMVDAMPVIEICK